MERWNAGLHWGCLSLGEVSRAVEVQGCRFGEKRAESQTSRFGGPSVKTTRVHSLYTKFMKWLCNNLYICSCLYRKNKFSC